MNMKSSENTAEKEEPREKEGSEWEGLSEYETLHTLSRGIPRAEGTEEA